jgi:hypothetical protein
LALARQDARSAAVEDVPGTRRLKDFAGRSPDPILLRAKNYPAEIMVHENGSQSLENRLKLVDSGRHFDVEMPASRPGTGTGNFAVSSQRCHKEILDVISINIVR